MRDDINRAVAAAHLYSEAYFVKVDVAIRWAVSRLELFPNCPLRVEHLTVSKAAIDTRSLTVADVTAETSPFPNQVEQLVNGTPEQDGRAGASYTKALRKRRYARIDAFQEQHRLRGRKAFCEKLGISTAALGGIVRNETRKYAPDVKLKLLRALAITAEEYLVRDRWLDHQVTDTNCVLDVALGILTAFRLVKELLPRFGRQIVRRDGW